MTRPLLTVALIAVLCGCPFVEYDDDDSGDDDDNGPDDDDFGPDDDDFGDDDDTGPDDDDFIGTPECDSYCADVEATCPGLYPSLDTCLQGCGMLGSGNPGDETGDSLACRLHHLGLAETDPGHCSHAGYFGGTSADGFPCSSDLCVTYCRIVQTACFGGDAQYPSVEDCVAQCASFPSSGNLGDTTGNSLQCRITHGELAFGQPQEQCVHAGPTGGEFCGD